MNEKKSVIIYWVVCAVIAVLMGMSLFVCLTDDYVMVSIGNYRSILIAMMGLIVSGILLFGIAPNSLNNRQNRALTRLIIVMCLLMFFNLRCSFMEGRIGVIDVNLVHIKVEYSLLGICHSMILYCFWAYVREEVQLSGQPVKVGNIICRACTGLCILAEILNPAFGWLATFSSYGNITEGQHRSLSDIATLIIFTITIVAIVRSRSYPLKQKITLLTFEIFPVVAALIGFVFEYYDLIYPAYLFSLLVIYINIFSKQRHKIAEQQVILEKQNTALMISQIQPHFLYNVLTTISNLCSKDPKEARDTTVMFSRYLRTNLDSLQKDEPVPFLEELDHIKIYTELEKKRFKDRLNVSYEIEDSDFAVPSLGLQPLVENAIKHGICKKEEPGNLVISARKADGGHLVVIEDDGVGFDPSKPAAPDGKSHVGLTNTISRLEKMCKAKVTVTSSPGCGCRVEVLFP